MSDVMQKVRVVLTSVVTLALTAALVIQAVVDELGDELLPAGWVTGLLRVGVVLTGVVAVIRRVEPVLPKDQGLL